MTQTTFRSWRRRELGIALGVLVLLSAGLFWTPTTASASGPADDEATARFEVRFMESMIDHHQMAVEMGNVCLQRATHLDLLAECQNIVSSQSQQIQMMESWLRAWYDIDYAPAMSKGDERMVQRLASESDGEFEISFMEMMIKHHRAAIREATRCERRAEHGELLSLCSNIIESQSSEIMQMTGWLCAWYQECRYERRGR